MHLMHLLYRASLSRLSVYTNAESVLWSKMLNQQKQKLAFSGLPVTRGFKPPKRTELKLEQGPM